MPEVESGPPFDDPVSAPVKLDCEFIIDDALAVIEVRSDDSSVEETQASPEHRDELDVAAVDEPTKVVLIPFPDVVVQSQSVQFAAYPANMVSIVAMVLAD